MALDRPGNCDSRNRIIRMSRYQQVSTVNMSKRTRTFPCRFMFDFVRSCYHNVTVSTGDISRGLAGTRRTPRHALPRPPGAGLARLQRTGVPQFTLLLRGFRGRVPVLAHRSLPRHRRPQQRMGDHVLESALHQLRRDRPSRAEYDLRQPGPPPGLAPLLLGRTTRPVPRRTRCAATHHTCDPGNHELHGRNAGLGTAVSDGRHGLRRVGSPTGSCP